MVMLPAFTLLLAFELSSAMRVLFTIAVVLASLSRRDVRETGVESVLSAVLAGALAVAFTVLYAFWPEPGAALLLMAFLGLLAVPYAFDGPHRGAVALAYPAGLAAARHRGGEHGLEDARVEPLFGRGRVLRGRGARVAAGDARLATGAETCVALTAGQPSFAAPRKEARRLSRPARAPSPGSGRPPPGAAASRPPAVVPLPSSRADAGCGRSVSIAATFVDDPLRKRINPQSRHPPNDWSRLRFSLRLARELRHFCRRSLSRSPPGFLP